MAEDLNESVCLKLTCKGCLYEEAPCGVRNNMAEKGSSDSFSGNNEEGYTCEGYTSRDRHFAGWY